MSERRVTVIVVMLSTLLLVATQLPRIQLPEGYHSFADQRMLFFIPNFFDVASNIPFGLLGLYGVHFLMRPRRNFFSSDIMSELPFLAFFLAIIFVMLGSAYYHWSPSNSSLFWDRLPIVVAFTCLFVGFLSDRFNPKIVVIYVLPPLLLLSFSALAWDSHHSDRGGDLRFYLLVQLCPIIILPILCRLYPKGRLTTEKHLWQMIAWYGAAKAFEYFDSLIFSLTNETLSGHTLKHLAASMAVFVVIRMLKEKRRYRR